MDAAFQRPSPNPSNSGIVTGLVGSRQHRALRCPQCRLHESLCVCSLIEPLTLRTRVTLLLHRKEAPKTTNSGRLASLALTNSSLLIRPESQFGPNPQKLAPEDLLPTGYCSMVLFPCETALPIEEISSQLSLPLNLIVPDGTWRQAQKTIHREALLKDLPRVRIPLGKPSSYHLRRETKEGGLATFEAIARALGVLEGLEVQTTLEKLFYTVVRRTLQTRGVNPERSLLDIPSE